MLQVNSSPGGLCVVIKVHSGHFLILVLALTSAYVTPDSIADKADGRR